MTSKAQRQVLMASVVGLCMAFLGWLGLGQASYIEAVPGLGIFLTILALPGVLVEIILAVAFSPQGGHDNQTFAWIVFPSNAVFYFTFFLLLNRMWVRYRESRNSSLDDVTKTPAADTSE